MPAKGERFSKINLLPLDEFERSFLGKALKWALTAGKGIVIMTEFVVILAFLSRFWLDRQVNDINEELIQKQAVVDSYIEVEERMRAIQERIDLVEEVDETTLKARAAIGSIIATTPRDVIYESIDVSNTTLTLSGISGSETSFAALLSAVRESETWTNVSLGDVEFNQRKGGVIFTINARAAEATRSAASNTL